MLLMRQLLLRHSSSSLVPTATRGVVIGAAPASKPTTTRTGTTTLISRLPVRCFGSPRSTTAGLLVTSSLARTCARNNNNKLIRQQFRLLTATGRTSSTTSTLCHPPFSSFRPGGLYRYSSSSSSSGKNRPYLLLNQPFGGPSWIVGCLGTAATNSNSSSRSVAYYSNQSGGGGGQQRPPSGGGSRIARGVGLVGAASVLFGKTKYILAALKVTKIASLGSMVLTIGTYSLFFGWPYAVGVVGLIFVHETGHAIVMHNRGIPFKPAVFIPFMGAVIATKQNPRDAWEDALIAAGGPALGSLGAAAVAVAAHQTQSQLLFALADFGFMVNLFNLLPLGSMDGGRIAGAISPYAGVVGLGVGGFLAYQVPIYNPLFYLIMLGGGYETFMRFYDPSFTPPNYYKISSLQRGMITTGYFGLIACLLTAMAVNHKYQKPPEVLIRERELVEKSWDMR